MSSNKVWAALGVGMMAIFGAAALKAKQTIDDQKNGTSPEGRAFAAALNRQLEYSRSVRIPGALLREEMDPDGEPVHGWSKSTETMPVLIGSPLEDVLVQCLQNEDYWKRFSGVIFCGWRVQEEASAINGEKFWRLRQTVFFKQPEMVQG